MIVLAEAGFVILAIGDVIKTKWLRILVKIMSVPGLVVGAIVLFALAFGGSSGSQSSAPSATDHRKKRAAEEYKRAATIKAGAVMRGQTGSAAKAQERMDRAMADMVGGNSDAARRYKQAANHKAGAVMHGQTDSAAKAQKEMDKAMADMIRDKNN